MAYERSREDLLHQLNEEKKKAEDYKQKRQKLLGEYAKEKTKHQSIQIQLEKENAALKAANVKLAEDRNKLGDLVQRMPNVQGVKQCMSELHEENEQLMAERDELKSKLAEKEKRLEEVQRKLDSEQGRFYKLADNMKAEHGREIDRYIAEMEKEKAARIGATAENEELLQELDKLRSKSTGNQDPRMMLEAKEPSPTAVRRAATPAAAAAADSGIEGSGAMLDCWFLESGCKYKASNERDLEEHINVKHPLF